ncbi:hypothetical protein [Flavobacterium sp.]|jgi:hypothetical protein|uniref:hypothetical protein n=1 Tax=Flavobacterium sp. TaxID=239 RepID=UPI0037C11CBB
MKNIFVALALFAALGVSAQTKKGTTAPKTSVVATQLTPEAAAERDLKALDALVGVDENLKADVNKIFITKYRTKADTSLSAERMATLDSYVESQLATYLGDTKFAKLKANTKLYNQLVK